MAARRSFKKEFAIYTGPEDVPYEIRGERTFIDRSLKVDSVLLILAGYKSVLWDDVFGRISKFLPKGIDVCVVTSGLVNEDLKKLCERENWSYLATKRNNINLAQNIAIELHPKAEWIYKLDEDVFITKGFFENLKATYELAKKTSRMEIGFVGPIMPLHGYGHARLLEKLNLVSEWEKRFGSLYYTEGLYDHKQIIDNPEVAKFMWGSEIPELKDVDALNDRFAAMKPDYRIYSARFGIAAILYSRKFWLGVGRFPVESEGCGMGADEFAFCQYCMSHSHAIVVSENSVVGHFAFGKQTKAMFEYYKILKKEEYSA